MSTFDEAMSFALRANGKEGLKQNPEQLQAMFMMEKMCLLCGCLQGLASRCVTRCSPLCSTTRNEALLAVPLLTVV